MKLCHVATARIVYVQTTPHRRWLESAVMSVRPDMKIVAPDNITPVDGLRFVMIVQQPHMILGGIVMETHSMHVISVAWAVQMVSILFQTVLFHRIGYANRVLVLLGSSTKLHAGTQMYLIASHGQIRVLQASIKPMTLDPYLIVCANRAIALLESTKPPHALAPKVPNVLYVRPVMRTSMHLRRAAKILIERVATVRFVLPGSMKIRHVVAAQIGYVPTTPLV
jgi:hypothetical protein